MKLIRLNPREETAYYVFLGVVFRNLSVRRSTARRCALVHDHAVRVRWQRDERALLLAEILALPAAIALLERARVYGCDLRGERRVELRQRQEDPVAGGAVAWRSTSPTAASTEPLSRGRLGRAGMMAHP